MNAGKRVLSSLTMAVTLAVSLLGSGAAYATAGGCIPNSGLSCFVNEVYMDQNNWVWVAVPGAPNISTACHNSAYLAFDGSTARGKALLAVVQAALLSGKKTYIYGTGTCFTFGTDTAYIEELAAVWISR